MKTSKTRNDAWGEDLTDEKRWELYNLTRSGGDGDDNGIRLRTYEDAKRYIAQELCMESPSRSGWYRFLSRMRQQMQLQQIYRVGGNCESAKEMTSEAKIDFKAASEAMRAKAVDASMDGDLEAAKIYASAATAFAAEARKAEESAKRNAAENRAKKAEALVKDLQEKVKELEQALQEAGKINIADPAKVAAEMDKLLGRKS